MDETAQQERLRNLPSVDKVLSDLKIASLLEKVPRQIVLNTIRDYLENLRSQIVGGSDKEFDIESLAKTIEQHKRLSLRRAINGIGVVLHTGLGRAPLSKTAQAALIEVSENFSNLAIDLENGRRAERYFHVENLLRDITGAESALVVNNNAAATMLILNTLAENREVVISRGQLVEIGGAFRMPDVMKRSNAIMKEVGTTNRTHLRDYAAAINEKTGLIIRVHMSNYRIIGFTKEVSLEDLVALGRKHNIPVVDDLGSGAFIDLSKFGLPKEPMVQESIGAGADIICFSGDKLIGGPQCGIIVGKKQYIDAMKKNPLTRALRCGKLTYTALEATLRLFLDEEKLLKGHALLRILLKPINQMEKEAKSLYKKSQVLFGDEVQMTIKDSLSEIGGGSLATESMPTKVLAIKPKKISVEALAKKMRLYDPPVFGRIENDEYLLDFRTIRSDEIATIANALKSSLS
ncbi:MAG: L-seryl-tRNA(Sec) selenium transferase [candidate division WOR-3 bacterium]|nr:L-seryl-tRNA(Sec) selenium transferase [candidate division WOR-3 bacterium]MDH5684564.1 L-seryl-tRNA(Sec) selenium transferase [candidate division WOR-3 bacterium]